MELQVPIAILTGVTVTALGGAAMLVHRGREEARKARARALAERDAMQPPGTRPRLVQTVHRVGQMVSSGRTSTTLQEELAGAGYHGTSAASVYLGAKVLLFLVGLAGFGFVAFSFELPLALRVFLVLVGCASLFFVPNLWVAVRRDRRRTEIRRYLPDAVDLLEICVSAGMGLDMAWNAVSDELRRVSTTLADEMELTTLEINLGVQRAVAMRHMAERTGVEDISSLVALLVQSERFGASIVEALRTFARSMRELRSQRAEESAEKMSVKLLFPMVVFIFPALLIVMVGPAVLELVRALSSR